MGLCNSPDIFQEKMNELMHDLEFARAYLDDLLVICKGTFLEHLEHLENCVNQTQWSWIIGKYIKINIL